MGPDKWVPSPPSYQAAMLPYWGNNRTFVPANNVGIIDPPPPLSFSTSPNSTFYNEAWVVYNTVNNLTAEQKLIANYWSDGGGTYTPPGHNISLAMQVIRNRHLNLIQSAVILAKIGIGLSDAGIVCWRAKFKTSLLRPITYINNYINPGWTSFIATPPFPSYTSGHASFSGATAKLLSASFGYHFSFDDSSNVFQGFAPRRFSNFYEAAEEAAASRLYGGIHYQFDNDRGLSCGKDIGGNVQSLRW